MSSSAMWKCATKAHYILAPPEGMYMDAAKRTRGRALISRGVFRRRELWVRQRGGRCIAAGVGVCEVKRCKPAQDGSDRDRQNCDRLSWQLMRTNGLLPEGVCGGGGVEWHCCDSRTDCRYELVVWSQRSVAHTVDFFFFFSSRLMSSVTLTNVFSQICSWEESSNLCQPGLLLGGDELVFVPYLLAKGQCLLSCEHCVQATGLQFQFKSWTSATPTG